MSRFLHCCIALVWVANGLLAKVLNLVPRHTLIVARILGLAHARPLTIAIGLGEIALGAWVLSGRHSRWCAVVQLVLIGSMNVLEAILAPDLLLWGHLNAVFAGLFMALIYWQEFRTKSAVLR
ncbi:hypothetical protein HHL22_06540 [Hymenobacter sp. RP-2-7]|uniref:DoxX family protein n=1 Tax=Hymenobacter polaris TaxID=2682546 RepID=A0A7Y0FLV1_9BACT|nr:DoxX-like family protein [Hymenobacter polaris]NML64860.1 hypothetical protein [Hymenobacter polaris]